MTQYIEPSYYKRGHSDYTIATHFLRTAESDATFLIPHIKKTDHILDVGCGPGTITTGLAKYASEGETLGIDISPNVLEKAKTLAAKTDIPIKGPGSVRFEEANVLEGLPYPDDTFDIIFSSQVLGHLPQPDLPVQALVEMRRVLKPGGILASRDAIAQHFYPRSLNLDRLWSQNQLRGSRGGAPEADPTGSVMPALFRAAGFDSDKGKVLVGVGGKASFGPETRQWLLWRATGQLQPGDPFYQSWLDAGIKEEEIGETLRAIRQWAETEDAWFAMVSCEMLAWK